MTAINMVPDGSHATSIKLPAYERCLRFFDGIKRPQYFNGIKRPQYFKGGENCTGVQLSPAGGAGLLIPLREESGSVQLRMLLIRLLLRSRVSYLPIS
jgi:hypothetical protein